jgi:hypothetical protein
MRLNRRVIEVPSGRITQYLLGNGKIVAEFHDREAHAIFCLGITHRTDLTVYDLDRKEAVFEPKGEQA